ncbi:Eco57I restriction-modification methylase domain-containing protein [Natrinema sp. LN54]|uniref:Eco57I restriction-modification methylase domain-containing protein n=1 Tax=Natrinema sp. LN54 TaxID=3458705 RepID=UPI0040352D09
MSNEFQFGENPDKFEVTKDLIEEVKNNPPKLDDLDGYQGHPIKGVGDVYTPVEIVTFILDNIGFNKEANIEDRTIIDLSCGTGSFIREIVRRIRSRLIEKGLDPSNPEDAETIVNTITENVYASDLNSIAIWRTAQVVIDELIEEIELLDQNDPVLELKFYNDNSLLPTFNYGIDGFDFIVGNPPYIKNSEIKPEIDDIYRSEYETAKGKYDLYSVFFERGIDLLNNGGKFGFVTPDRFFRADYGEPLRSKILSDTHIKALIDLEDDPFPKVDAYPVITIFEKEDKSFPRYQVDNSFYYCTAETDDLSEISVFDQDLVHFDNGMDCVEYNQSDLDQSAWDLQKPEIKKVKSALEDKLIRFDKLPIDIRAGIATAADDVFIINKQTANKLEDDILVPVIRGRDVQKGSTSWDDSYIINPYRHDKSVVNISEYPKTKSYLSKYKSKLEDRYCVRERNKRWYETHDTIDYNQETKRRIITPDVTSDNRFAIVEGSISHNTCYSIYYEGDLELLIGYLNSSVFRYLLKSSMPEIRTGYWRQMKRDLKQIPVIDPSIYTAEQRDEMIRLVSQKDWDKIDDVIYRILDVPDAHINVIESF